MASTLNSLTEWIKESYLASGNEAYLEHLYERYLAKDDTLDPHWQSFFDQMVRASGGATDTSHEAVITQFLEMAKNKSSGLRRSATALENASSQDARFGHIVTLIEAYRRLGHLKATIDPLGFYNGIDTPLLSLAYHGLSDANKTDVFPVTSFLAMNQKEATLAEIYARLKDVYCGTIGFEFMHINRKEEVEWIRERIEKHWANFKPTADEKKRILDRLVVADGFEKYLGFKYVGQKRFSLEGVDSLIPFLDALITRGVSLGIKDIVIGMSHRGRLNVLANIVGKDVNDIFAAFEGKGISETRSGDVKYHLGSSANIMTSAGPAHIALAFNPSHLEIVSPVVQGSVRARQRRRADSEHNVVMPIQLHGDAAFAGQGVVMETFNMSQARWFTVGGSIHVVVNNQVGFTTSNPQDSRSTLYCTDVAKMIEAPILHVNANDPEAALFAALFAIDYRQTFKRDVVIDLIGYRRHGHNEADEPSATQPVMYKKIKSMQPAYQLYADQLRQEGVIADQVEKQLADSYRDALDAGRAIVPLATGCEAYPYGVKKWSQFVDQDWSTAPIKTAITRETLQRLGKQLGVLPADFVLQLQVKKMFEAQLKMTEGSLPINWGYAEMMAFASLLDEGHPIRLCGQDAARGTFAHRHAVLHDQNTDALYIRLSHLSDKQAQINIVDSFLSEEAVLAFEYGYATTEPNFLVIWEAQFGDFANGAQVVIDQFISSGEQKWMRLCGLVLLLPHGYEGQGPEHSSARLERYLQLCAQNNMQVCVPTTPAQIFHLLRRQIHAPFRKPLIIMSPKNLLRNPLAVSQLDELVDGQFQFLLPEMDALDAGKVERVIFCCGKVYYQLLEYRRANALQNTAIIRIEQLYPFANEECSALLSQYPKAKDIVWCQEESQNQGAWPFISLELSNMLQKNQVLRYAGRKASASPAAGYHAVHEHEQAALVADAFMK